MDRFDVRSTQAITLVFFDHAWTLWLYMSPLPSFFIGKYAIEIKYSVLFISYANER
ncbi:hypothetical protein LMG29542_05560 [Paraburkholderia humisilvae]|uniref:Uncharacterized protein n=1 Tax=Paraburkholderia humisilvae TaxID=627669 RepID=A0A6J5EPT9_9BURK|nr:hypothetical protein LMG29542_05560 [Paraburkholderia humisilvae]